MKRYDFHLYDEDKKEYFYWMSGAYSSEEEAKSEAIELYLNTNQKVRYRENGTLKKSHYYPERR